RTVVRDVTAAVGDDKLRAHPLGRDQHVVAVGGGAERVDVRVLEVQQVVVGGAVVQRALQAVGFPVGDPTQPTHAEHQSSSSSQLCCSNASRIPRRNADAYAPSKARWSHVRTSRPVWWMAMASSPSGPETTTGRFLIPSVDRIATCGWLMIGI